MGKVIKKDHFEKGLSLEERIDSIGHDVDRATLTAPSKIVSRSDHQSQTEVHTILADAKRRAQRIQGEAKQVLAEIEHKVAEEKQRGYEDGHQEGLAEVTEQLTAASQLANDFLQQIEPQVMQLVYECCEKIVGRELSQNKTAVVDVIRQALRTLSATQMTIRLHPKDLQTVRDHKPELAQVVDAMCTLAFKEDPMVSAGGCVIESEIGTIDARLETQLAAIKKALKVE